MNLKFLQIISIFSVLQLTLLVFYFCFNKKKSNKWLTFLFFNYAIILLASTIFSSSAFIEFYNFAYLCNYFILLIGPTYYFYIKSKLSNIINCNLKTIAHFIPFTLFFVYSFTKSFLDYDIITLYSDKCYFVSLTISSTILYGFLSINLLLKNIQNFKINQMKNNSFWFFIFFFSCTYIYLYKSYLIFIWTVQGLFPLYLLSLNIYFILNFIAVNFIIFIILKQPVLFFETKKYEKSIFSGTDVEKYKKDLLLYMTQNKPYLDPNISLNKLAKNINLTKTYLSQLLNDEFKQNFYDFINKYRIEESKKLLADQSHSKKAIIEIIYEVGFNSKSTFNSAFKKFTGLTPKEFKKTDSK